VSRACPPIRSAVEEAAGWAPSPARDAVAAAGSALSATPPAALRARSPRPTPRRHRKEPPELPLAAGVRPRRAGVQGSAVAVPLCEVGGTSHTRWLTLCAPQPSITAWRGVPPVQGQVFRPVGSVKKNVLPDWIALSTHTRPPCASTICTLLTMARDIHNFRGASSLSTWLFTIAPSASSSRCTARSSCSATWKA